MDTLNDTLNLGKFEEIRTLLAENFDTFLDVFMTELSDAISVLQDSSANTTLIAHSQKSTCALIGAQELSNTFMVIERNSKDNTDVSQEIAQLNEQLTKLKKQLNFS